MSCALTLTVAQALALLRLAEAADVVTTYPDGRRRRAAAHALDRLREALDALPPPAVELELDAIADAVEQIHDRGLLDALEGRVRALAETARRWAAIERAQRAASWRGDAAFAGRCEALLRVARVDDPRWQAEVAALLAAAEAAEGAVEGAAMGGAPVGGEAGSPGGA